MNKTIHNPSLANVEEHGSNSATFTIEPLHTGYGMTLGNSMRRVLLSSIAGAAPIGFRVDGITHEFTSIAGVKEDAVDITLNIKGIRASINDSAEGPITVRLSKSGSGKVLASDIQLTSDITIANPDHVLATIDDPKTTLSMDIVFTTGRGYQTVEQSRKENEIADMIVTDAVFSPVTRVRYRVESTRVGQITDLDKLHVTVDTDGTISPQDAFEEAAAILINQYSALAGQTRLQPSQTFAAANEQTEDNNRLMTPIEDLNLSPRTTNALLNNEIFTIKDLVTLDDGTLKDLKGFGSKALDEVRDKLAEMEF